MLLASVFLVSLSSLAVEVLLTRVFAFSQWHHLSFMVISIVMFGFGASGTLMALFEGGRPGRVRALVDSGRYTLLIVMYCASAAGALVFVQVVPLDYFRMPLQPLQGLYLAATYLVLLLPFVFSGALISAAFAAKPGRSGWIYAASMAGAALGALLPAAVLPLLGVGQAVVLCAALPLVPAGVAVVAASVRRSSLPLLSGLIPVAAAAALLAALPALPARWAGGLLELQASPYKLLAQTLQFPDSRILETVNTLRGRVDRVESPALRFAPGLSLQYTGELPERELLIRDGDNLYVQFAPEGPEFSRYLHSHAAALLPETRERALVLQAGGGLGLPHALASGFREIRLAVDHPWIAGRASRLYGSRAAAARLEVVGGNLRRVLGRDPGRFDLIHLEQWGPSIPGMASLNQEHLLTLEAFRGYLAHLSPGGVLVLSRRLLLPPADSLRLFATAFRALADSGNEEPQRHLAIVHGFDSFSLICAAAPLREAQIEVIRQFCRRLNFDLLYHADITEQETGRFTRFEEPYHFRELQALEAALLRGREGEYFRGYFLDVTPATDDRPFHNRFTKALRIGDLYRATGSRFYLLLMSGETIVLVVLGIALAVGLALLAVPRLALRRADALRSGEARRTRRRLVLYFLAVGGGFMLVEMAFIKSYTLLFGDPIIAFTVVLAALLVASGLGGAVSARWGRRGLGRSLALLLAVLALWALVGGASPPAGSAGPGVGVVGRLLVAPPALQWGGAVLLLLPFGFLLGIPFPTALRCWVRSAGERSYLWAANGVASVVASIVSVPVAMSWGISRIVWLAGACYAVAWLLALILSRRRQPPMPEGWSPPTPPRVGLARSG